jgi:hypothetical protein
VVISHEIGHVEVGHTIALARYPAQPSAHAWLGDAHLHVRVCVQRVSEGRLVFFKFKFPSSSQRQLTN